MSTLAQKAYLLTIIANAESLMPNVTVSSINLLFPSHVSYQGVSQRMTVEYCRDQKSWPSFSYQLFDECVDQGRHFRWFVAA